MTFICFILEIAFAQAGYTAFREVMKTVDPSTSSPFNHFMKAGIIIFLSSGFIIAIYFSVKSLFFKSKSKSKYPEDGK